MGRDKISNAQFNSLKDEFLEAEQILKEAQKDFEDAQWDFVAVIPLIIVDDCPTCEGTGEIQAESFYNHNMDEIKQYDACHHCDGKGYL